MATQILVNIGSGNDLLPDSTKLLPEPMLTYRQWDPVPFIWWQFYKKHISRHWLKLDESYSSKMSLKSPRGQWVNIAILNIFNPYACFPFHISANNACHLQSHYWLQTQTYPFIVDLAVNTLMLRPKGPPFRRQEFQMHLLEWKYMNFDKDFTEVCSQYSNWQWTSTGSDNGLAPARRHAIIWINVG